MHKCTPAFTHACLLLASKRGVRDVSWRSLKTCNMHTTQNTHHTHYAHKHTQHTHAHTHTHNTHTSHMHTHAHAHTHADTHAHTRTHTRAHTHTICNTHMHTRAHFSITQSMLVILLRGSSVNGAPRLTCIHPFSLTGPHSFPQAPHQAIQLAYAVTHLNGNGL